MVLPIFSSHYSFGGSSILTVEEIDKEETEINENKPVSIFAIAKKHNLKDVFIAEKSLSGLIESYNAAQKAGLNIRFGFKVICCANINDKSENSFNSEHKIIVWLNDSAGYENLIKLVSKAQTDGFYYIPRVDCNILREFWSDSLLLSIPFYDSFIYKNVLEFGECIPDFPVKPTFFIESNNLPFDSVLKEKVLEFANNENCEVVNTKSIFYYRYSDFEPYLVNRCINNRTNLEKPEIDNMSSDRFCFEDYLNIIGEKLKKV